MPPNTANPSGPQYGSGRRDDSSSGITLPTDILNAAWDSELARIGQELTLPTIPNRAARAKGFAWGLRAADLINEDMHKAMEEAINQAENAAYAALGQGNNDHE